ncbi:hypothetical protein KGY73_11405 [bacterium]|nr:hypothetical protein [bacterium]
MERRSLQDRRKKPTKPISRYMIFGRRMKARRASEDKNYYVDRYKPGDLFVVLSILVLCVVDGYFTLYILSNGGEELNPFMSYFLDKNIIWTLVLKYFFTLVGVVTLLIHKNFTVLKKIKIYYFAYVILFLYLGLVFIEAYFLFHLSPVFFNHIFF